MRKVSAKNIQWLEKELPILEMQGIVSSETADGIKSYYSENTASGMHWAVIAFAVLGSLLIGSGIILLFAHNWEELSRPARSVLSFCPLIIGALLSLTALMKNGGVALRESAGIFHSLAVGGSIALIGQTYHIPSNVPGFLLTWSLLVLPLVFLLRSTGALLIYLGLICGWSGNAQVTYGQAAGFWLLIIPAFAKLACMIRTDRDAPDTLISFFGILITVCISTGIVFERTVPGLWIVAYSALLSGAGLLGVYLYKDRGGWSNPPKTFGLIGVALLAYLFTWTYFWEDIGWNHIRNNWNYRPWGCWIDGTVTLGLVTAWAAAAARAFRRDSVETVILAVFPLFALTCFLLSSTVGGTVVLNALIFNGFMLFFGITYIVMGCRHGKLRQLNGGMGILSLLLVTRFFDEEFGFMARGVVFIILGAGFLAVNLVMARRKKQMEVSS